jgi:hypothetical protein
MCNEKMIVKSKIKILKKLFQRQREQTNRYEDYCEGGDMPPGLFESNTRKFRFYFTAFPNLQSPSLCAQELDKVVMRPAHRSFTIAYNSTQKHLYDRLFEDASAFDNDWFGQNDLFLQKLSVRQRFALAALANKSQQHAQAYLKNEDLAPFCARVRKWNPRIYGILPIFFPLYQKYKAKLPKGQPTSATYDYVVRTICPTLTDEEIIEGVVELVKDIRHIFLTCPKTTRTMTLWRGIRSIPSYRHPGFTATSANPLHALQYAGKECCFQKISVMPGTPLLFLGGLSTFKDELECVLPDNTQFYEIKRYVSTIPSVPNMKSKCPTKTRRIIIQHAAALL